MKIVVAIKQVPARDSQLRIAPSGQWIEFADLAYEINEPDAYALEEALQLREQHGCEVVVVSAGPERVAGLFDTPGLQERPELADLNDPGNAGTLLRSAEALGASGVVFGNLGVDPFHPKVVRGAMGALFRLPLALASPEEVELAARSAGIPVFGLAMDGDALAGIAFPPDFILAVGHERHGLGRWEGLCGRLASIPMRGHVESLNAGVAGSIALYEALRGRP